MAGRAPAVPDAPPLVFLGPSAPASDVAALLPGAEIRPPARRGDLHAARLLRYSVLVLIDGVFAEENAVSPREVVDVLEDGAALIGAASMGALRAADCAPAGAEGVGHVYRLFRLGAIGSEDEVAVTFNPERPFPALTQSLAGIRVALRRGVRAGRIGSPAAARLFAAAQALHYSMRSWRTIFAEAGLAREHPALAPFLEAEDVKRADARAALGRVARRTAMPGWAVRPRRSRTTFGLLSEGRERRPDPLLGLTEEATRTAFLLWLLGSGRAARYLGPGESALGLLGRLLADGRRSRWPDPDAMPADDAPDACVRLRAALDRAGALEAELYRFSATGRAVRAARDAGLGPTPADLRQVEFEIAVAHGATDWHSLTADMAHQTVAWLEHVRACRARAKAFRRALEGSGWGTDD